MPHKVQFSVLHASSVDVGYSPKELEVHSPLVKGWQSGKFCPYPQEIILKMGQMTRIKKLQLLAHQYLIPTKVEVYIGSLPPDHAVARQGTRYKRLGYVTMSDNEKTSFRARELKSVHVDAVGQYIRLVLHKSYINKLNLYNQVGIIAINVLGDEVDDDGNVIPDDKQQQVNELISKFMPNGPPYQDKEGAAIDPAVLGAVNNPEIISPMDDLAFDMYQDPEVAQIIRKLDLRKNEAVLQEEYEVAKRLKQAIVDLQKVGEKIGRFEVEKRRAIEIEDYDLAQAKKTQMDEYRSQIYKQIELHDLLETPKEKTPTRKTKDSPGKQLKQRSQHREEPVTQRASANTDEQDPASPRNSENTPLINNDDRPLPALEHSPKKTTPPPAAENTPKRLADLPEEKDGEMVEADPEENNGTTSSDEQSPGLTPKILREASGAIDVFGEKTIYKVYSKSWSLRKESLDEVRAHLSGVSDTDKEHLRNIMRVTVFLIKKLLKDGVIAVFRPTLDLITYLVEDWLVAHKMTRQDTGYVIDNVLPDLMARIVDTNARLRQASVDYIVSLAGMPEVRPLHIIPTQCTVPFKPNSQAKMASTRVDIVKRLLQDLGTKHNSGIKVDNVMTFALKALEHIAGEVRDAAMQLIFELYKTNGTEVRERLPSEEDPKTLKNPLYLKIFDGFNKIEGKPTRAELKAQARKEKEAKKRAKQEQIEGLQKQLADLRAATQAAATAQQTNSNLNTNNNQTLRAPSPLNKGRQRIRAPSIAEQSEMGEDDQCVFCGEKNDAFRDGGMDVHYWKRCPMLKKCPNCKQVVEISGQTDHFLTECASQGDYARCPRCSEAHKKTELDKYVSKKKCQPLDEGMARCPLCEMQIPANDDSWKKHLMGPGGCPQNPRKDLKKAPDEGMTRCPLCEMQIPANDDSWKKHLMGPGGCPLNLRKDLKKAKEKKGPGTTVKQGPRKTKGTKGVKAR